MTQPRFVRQITHSTFGKLDLFQRGPVVFAIPALDDSWPSEIKNAVDRRRRATLSGRCDCGNSVGPITGDGQNLYRQLEHEDDCPANDEQIVALFRRHGVRP
jgi:hypothetical protein